MVVVVAIAVLVGAVVPDLLRIGIDGRVRVVAVVVVHDANDNKKLDNGILGFGAEAFAYSNGASNPLFGRASFEDAKIEVNDDLEIEISLD